jgi:DNA recombination protein RmuC
MLALKTLARFWQVERRNENADAIADRAGKLYDKFVGFLEDMRSLGERLNQAQGSYTGAMGKLSSGRGSLVKQIEDLKTMGAKTGKSVPADLLDVEETKAFASSLAR